MGRPPPAASGMGVSLGRDRYLCADRSVRNIEWLSSKDIAGSLAIADCRNKGGLTCKIEVTYDNKCAAVIVGDEGYVVTSRAYESDAIGAGISVCGGERNHCHALYTACSRSVRIR